MHIRIYTGEVPTCETMVGLTRLQRHKKALQECYQQYMDCPSNTFRASFSATSLQLMWTISQSSDFCCSKHDSFYCANEALTTLAAAAPIYFKSHSSICLFPWPSSTLLPYTSPSPSTCHRKFSFTDLILFVPLSPSSPINVHLHSRPSLYQPPNHLST